MWPTDLINEACELIRLMWSEYQYKNRWKRSLVLHSLWVPYVMSVHLECRATPTITTSTTIIRMLVRPRVPTHRPNSLTPSSRTSPPISAPDICKGTAYQQFTSKVSKSLIIGNLQYYSLTVINAICTWQIKTKIYSWSQCLINIILPQSLLTYLAKK